MRLVLIFMCGLQSGGVRDDCLGECPPAGVVRLGHLGMVWPSLQRAEAPPGSGVMSKPGRT